MFLFFACFNERYINLAPHLNKYFCFPETSILLTCSCFVFQQKGIVTWQGKHRETFLLYSYITTIFMLFKNFTEKTIVLYFYFWNCFSFFCFFLIHQAHFLNYSFTSNLHTFFGSFLTLLPSPAPSSRKVLFCSYH
jgi:hypothetical protein